MSIKVYIWKIIVVVATLIWHDSVFTQILFHHDLRRAKLHFNKHYLILCAATSRNETERIRKFTFSGGRDLILQNNETLDWAFSN